MTGDCVIVSRSNGVQMFILSIGSFMVKTEFYFSSKYHALKMNVKLIYKFK